MDQIREYATYRQKQVLDAIAEHGSQRKAAKALGVHHSVVSQSVKTLRANAARHGYSPDHDMTHPVPDGYHLRGLSTLYDESGEKRLQWVKSSVDNDRQEEIRQAALESMCEGIPKAKIVTPPTHGNADLLNLYVITDFHLGMLAWGEECGEDYDIKIAEKLLVDWFSAAIAQSPKADVGIFCQLGDFLHWDGMSGPLTPSSGHILDTDTRFQNVVRVAVRVSRRVIEMMRVKYKHVHVIMADANHDPASGVWLREMLAAMYDGTKAVTVDTSPDTYYAYPWGYTSLFFHHGHKKNLTLVSSVFAAKFKKTWGGAKHCFAHTGHYHHQVVREDNLMIIEQHRTLAAKDAYSSRGGYISGRSAKVITYHKNHGEVGRVTLTPEMVS